MKLTHCTTISLIDGGSAANQPSIERKIQGVSTVLIATLYLFSLSQCQNVELSRNDVHVFCTGGRALCGGRSHFHDAETEERKELLPIPIGSVQTILIVPPLRKAARLANGFEIFGDDDVFARNAHSFKKERTLLSFRSAQRGRKVFGRCMMQHKVEYDEIL